MNYIWNVKKIDGRPTIWCAFICETISNNVSVMVIIYCFPKLNQFRDHKIVTVIVFWECTKTDIIDDLFHRVLDDIGKIIKERNGLIFDESLNQFEIILTQQYFCKNLSSLEYFQHGDYYIGRIK